MRLFYSTDKSDTSFQITGDDHRHIVKVLRYKEGDFIEVIDGSGWIYNCKISGIQKNQLTADIINKSKESHLPYKLGIAISPVKSMSRFEWFIEKSVEIGVTDIFPLISTRTEKSNIKYDRIKRIIHTAMKQSRYVYEPVLHEKVNLDKLATFGDWESKYLAYINQDTNHLLSCEENIKSKILVAIGPEGGFTDEEAQQFVNIGFLPVSLGDRRLRTETAGIVSCQIIKTLQEIGRIDTIVTT